MESGNGGASSKGVCVPVSNTSEVFHNSILAPLQSACLYEESKQSFRYKSAVLIKNPALEEKYNAFRAKRRERGYSEEDLKETYGFLLFDDVNKAHALGETGVLTGNSTCTTLGDPWKGVYISMYSDCLDLNRWYHGKTGYVAIIRLTQGRVKKVLENYTQNFTAPTVGFDCHVSEDLPMVSAKTSSFLAFERTQYYIYELLDDGSNETAQSPSAACPFAIVSFSYTDTKGTLEAQEESSKEKKRVFHYLPWRGQLQVASHTHNVGLRSKAGALIPAKLPPVVKVDKAISMTEVIQMLPKPVFETCFSGEVFLDGLYCSLYELILDEAEETKKTFSLLLQEIKEKDLALPVPLNDGGFLLLLHPSHFLTYDDSGLNAPEVLQGLFVFPSSRVVQKDTKFGHRVASLTSDILRILPVLSYAQGEVEKTAFDPTEDLCEVLSHHMQSYAALINPGLTSSPSRELSIFPDQYDVPDAHKHLYSSPEWNNRAWQSFRSYMSKPVSFQLPVSKASEILAAGQEERREDLDDDVYICLSSPEGEPSNPVDMESEEQFTDETSLVNTETPLDSCVTSVEAQTDSKDAAPVVVPDNIKAGDETKVSEKSGTTELIKTDDADMKNSLTPPTPDDLSAELIVSITSAARNVTDESLSVISTVSATKNNDFQLSAFSAAKMQTVEANSLRDQTITIKKKDCSEVTNFSKTKRRKLRRGCSRGLRTESVSLVETFSSQEVKNLEKGDQAKASSGHSQLNNPLSTDWRKFRRRKRKFGSLSSRNKKVRPASVALDVAEGKNDPGPQSSEGTVSMELEVFPLRKKTERWDLKPVVSVCGRILVPHGSADDCDQVKSLKNQIQCTKQEPEKQDPVLVDTSVKTHESVIVEQESSVAAETAMDKTEVKTSKEGVNDPPVVESSCVNIEHSLLRQSDECLPSNIESSVHSSKNDGTETPPSETVKEQHADGFSQGKSVTKGEVLLSKLKSVLLRGKRKKHLRLSEGITTHTPQNTEPCPKKGKVDSADALRSNNAITIAQDTNVGVMDISNIPSVDPLFAYALGLTPKEKPDKVQKNEGQEPPKKDSTNTQAQIILHRPPQIMRRPPSICPRRGRIKTLKKHQGISAEHIKKNWWLHFQTPACFATEKYKECTSDNSVRKTVKEKMNSACSSTDALNLLADLALSASNDKVPPQPDPALERKPVTSLKKCGLTKDVTSAEQESVLHALLRQPAARSIQPLESPSPSHLVGDSEMIGLISKEHAYSLPPSSPLLLGLPGTPFQVPPLSGSTRLLHHHQQLHGDGKQTLHPSVCQENRRERNHRTPENQKKHMLHRPKFRRSRTFVNTDGSVKITRQWNENYDFTRDSKFASDAKGRAIIRALHGPWDVSIQDTAEEVRLIVHMWIGLFYSRSTARIFHIDTNFSYQFREEESLEMSSEKIPALVQSELCPSPSVTDTEDSSVSKALDLSKKDNSVVDPGSVVLDLSLRNSSAETVTSDPQVDGKETCVSDEQKGASDTLKASMSSFGLQETSTVQCHKTIVQPTKMIDEVKENRSFNKKEKDCQNDILSKSDGSSVPPLEEIESKPIWTENVQAALRIDYMLLKCNKEKTQVKHDTENSETTRTASTDSTKSVTDKVDEPKEADKVVHTDVHEKAEFKEVKKSEMKENPCQEGNQEPSPKEIHTSDYSTNKKLGIFCNGYTLEDENQLSKEKPQGVSPGKTEDGNEDVSCCTVHDGKKNTDEKHFGKDPELDGKDNCVPPVDVDKDLSNQPLPMICDSPDPEKDCSTDSSHQAPSGEKLSQADNKGDTRHYLLLTKLCPNGGPLSDKRVISEKARHTPRKNKRVKTEPTVQNNSENDICLANKPQNEKVELTTTDEGTRSVDKPSVDGCVPKSKDSLEAGSQNVAKVISSCGPSTDKPENQEIKSVVEEEKEDNTTQEEPIHHKSVSPQCEIKKCESEEALTKENPIKMEETYEMMEKSHSRVIIPFIGVDISGEDIVDPQTSPPKDQGEQAVEGPKGIPFIGETNCSDLATEICRTPEMSNKKEELSTLKIPLLDVSETEQLAVFGNESDDRCPTPTLDEKPYGCINFPGPSSSTSAFSSSETYKNFAQKCLSRGSTPTKDGMAVKQNLFHKSTINHDPDSHYGLHPDLELRTLRVLQSIDKFLSKSSCIDKSRTMGKPGMKNYLSQTPNHSNTYIPTSLTPGQSLIDLKDKKISISKSEVVSASTSQELHKESSDHFLIAPFKNKLEEVLGVRLQLKKMDSPLPQHHHERPDKLQDTSVGQDHFPSYSSASATECLQTRHKTAVQCNLTLEPRSYSQRPVMAVKPSKNDESHADYFCNDAQHEYFVKTKQIKTPEVASTAMPLEKNTESFKGQNDDELDSELSSKSGWWSNVNDSKINLDKAKLALLDASYRSQASEKMFSSSLYMQSFEEENSDRQQSFLTDRLHEKVGHTTEDSVEKDCSEASTSFVGCMPIKDEAIIDDDLKETPQSSLICTVYNTNQMKSLSFLEQVSQRCLQDDPTQVSIEQECLIFLEQIKQVLKRSDRGPVCQQETHDKSLPCTSPVTVNFSNLEEQEDSLDVLDTPSLVGQKIMVDMSDRKDFTEKENTSHRSSPGTGNLKEHAGISFATAECARLYEAMMDNVCAVRNIPSRSKHLRMDRGYKKTEPSNHFDFCDQMKREMDESFRSNLNSVVKKSCKTKYRFYILETSDDAIFKETKAQLEAEGHTAVQPTEFFLGEGSSSSLLIILRNEDIAEHICEVPHLLKLKKSPGVQFAGIDEPDDVVNLTHQELFTRGGFIMFDRAALEPLSLCNLKKCLEILEELSRDGKWKWMLHYRDHRRLKENARLSAEAKEKKHFLNFCQDNGILEVLPYHECDLMSRDQPDYLTCLIRLQVQNISARYPVFVTDTPTDSAFGRYGILTTTVNSFLTNPPSETFTA